MKKYAFDVKDIIPNCYEDVLYHYTTLDSLLSIVKNKTLRLTDYRFLNDKSEIIENIKLMQNFVKNSFNKRKKQCVDKQSKKVVFGETWQTLL